MTYARGTGVSVARSKAELDRILAKAGAGQRAVGSDDVEGYAVAAFTLDGRQVRLRVPLPRRDEKRFVYDPRSTWRRRPTGAATKAWEQACRERWRGLVLLVKAKLEAIALGVSTPEREFMADLQLPGGRTVYELLEEQLGAAAVPRLGAGT